MLVTSLAISCLAIGVHFHFGPCIHISFFFNLFQLIHFKEKKEERFCIAGNITSDKFFLLMMLLAIIFKALAKL